MYSVEWQKNVTLQIHKENTMACIKWSQRALQILVYLYCIIAFERYEIPAKLSDDTHKSKVYLARDVLGPL